MSMRRYIGMMAALLGASAAVGHAKQRRASIKTRNINRQKRHPNCRSAS